MNNKILAILILIIALISSCGQEYICGYRSEPYVYISFNDSIECTNYYIDYYGDTVYYNCDNDYGSVYFDDNELVIRYDDGELNLDYDVIGYDYNTGMDQYGYRIPIDMNASSVEFSVILNGDTSMLRINYKINVFYNDDCGYQIDMDNLSVISDFETNLDPNGVYGYYYETQIELIEINL